MEQRRIERAWFFIFLAAVTVAFLWLTLDFIEPVFWAAVLAIIFNPLQRQLEEHLKGRKTQAAVIATIMIVLVVFLPLVLLGVAVSQEALNFYDRIQSGNVNLQDVVSRIDPDTIGPRISESIGAAAQLIATRAVVVGQNLLGVAAQTALMLYLLFFFLRDGDKLLATLNYAMPMGDGRQQTLFRRFAAVTRATLKGSLLVGLVQGALGGVLFWVLGLRSPVFWGVIMAMLSLLPIVGPSIVWAPVALYLMFTGSMTKGIILVTGGVLVVGTADNIL
ncbi:MAG TPA: AI-2E family transporter, partial [Vicinamibacterales bacterium]